MKKVVIGAILLAMCAAFVAAENVGDQLGIYLRMECPGFTEDNDISDGSVSQIFYKYLITDPDGLVRKDTGLVQWEHDIANVQCTYVADKAGTWTCEGEFITRGITWNGAGWEITGGVCDTDSGDVEVFALPVCGNGIPENNEECDDGNNDDGDGCDSECIIEYCGDGIVNNGEECDGETYCEGDCTWGPVPSWQTYTLYQDTEPFILDDAYTRTCEYPLWNYDGCANKNYGSSRWISVYKKLEDANRGGIFNKRMYQKLDLMAIRNNPDFVDTVQGAILRMPTSGWGENEDVDVYGMLYMPWSEDTITHNNQPCGTDFSLCSGFTHVTNTPVNVEPGHVWELDITELVNEALANGQNEVNLVYKYPDETDTPVAVFREAMSKEGGEVYTTFPTQELEVTI